MCVSNSGLSSDQQVCTLDCVNSNNFIYSFTYFDFWCVTLYWTGDQPPYRGTIYVLCFCFLDIWLWISLPNGALKG